MSDKITLEHKTWLEASAIIQEVTLSATDADDPMRRLRGQIATIRIETGEAQIREALIKLGWTPPSEPPHDPH